MFSLVLLQNADAYSLCFWTIPTWLTRLCLLKQPICPQKLLPNEAFGRIKRGHVQLNDYKSAEEQGKDNPINPYRPIIPPLVFDLVQTRGGIIGPEHQNFPAAFGGRNQPIRSLFIPFYCCFLLARRRRENFCPFPSDFPLKIDHFQRVPGTQIPQIFPPCQIFPRSVGTRGGYNWRGGIIGRYGLIIGLYAVQIWAPNFAWRRS